MCLQPETFALKYMMVTHTNIAEITAKKEGGGCKRPTEMPQVHHAHKSQWGAYFDTSFFTGINGTKVGERVSLCVVDARKMQVLICTLLYLCPAWHNHNQWARLGSSYSRCGCLKMSWSLHTRYRGSENHKESWLNTSLSGCVFWPSGACKFMLEWLEGVIALCQPECRVVANAFGYGLVVSDAGSSKTIWPKMNFDQLKTLFIFYALFVAA